MPAMTLKESLQLIDGLELFKRLIKAGCEWHGDCLSRTWSELLVIPNADVKKKVDMTLADTDETLFKMDGEHSVWIK